MNTEEYVHPRRSLLTQVDLWLVWILSLVVGLSQLLISPISADGTVPGWPLVVLFYLFFLPGYALVAALFPARETETESEALGTGAAWAATLRGEYGGFDTLERVGLALASSVVLSALVGVLLHFSPWGITRFSLVVGISSVTVVLAGVAAVRRRALPAADQYVFPVGDALSTARAAFTRGSAFDRIVSVVVVVCVVVATASIAYGVTAERVGESPTELYLLGATESGAPAAEGYPTTFVVGESQTVTLGVTSHEAAPTEFVVVTQLERMQRTGDIDSVAVQRRAELSRFSLALEPGQTVESRQTITPTITGDRMRLTFLLYAGQPPENPTVENAYRAVHIWVDVYLPTDEVPTAVATPDGATVATSAARLAS